MALLPSNMFKCSHAFLYRLQNKGFNHNDLKPLSLSVEILSSSYLICAREVLSGHGISVSREGQVDLGYYWIWA